jgi:hypothetical protein
MPEFTTKTKHTECLECETLAEAARSETLVKGTLGAEYNQRRLSDNTVLHSAHVTTLVGG